jgi:uncharacterized protein YcbK (DUF882 family)
MKNFSGLTRRSFLKLSAASLALSATPWTVPAEARPMLEQSTRKLCLAVPRTNEVVKTTYWKNGHYDYSALSQFNRLMRDQHNGEIARMDPQLFDLLNKLQTRLGNRSKINVICAYRSPETNKWLATFQRGVAKNSFHLQGKAVDIRIPGVSSEQIYNAAISLKLGGVGFYSDASFVHLDTGPLRTW